MATTNPFQKASTTRRRVVSPASKTRQTHEAKHVEDGPGLWAFCHTMAKPEMSWGRKVYVLQAKRVKDFFEDNSAVDVIQAPNRAAAWGVFKSRHGGRFTIR